MSAEAPSARHYQVERDCIVVEAVRGLGAPAVSGTVRPEHIELTRAGQIARRGLARQERLQVAGLTECESSLCAPGSGASRAGSSTTPSSTAPSRQYGPSRPGSASPSTWSGRRRWGIPPQITPNPYTTPRASTRVSRTASARFPSSRMLQNIGVRECRTLRANTRKCALSSPHAAHLCLIAGGKDDTRCRNSLARSGTT